MVNAKLIPLASTLVVALSIPLVARSADPTPGASSAENAPPQASPQSAAGYGPRWGERGYGGRRGMMGGEYGHGPYMTGSPYGYGPAAMGGATGPHAGMQRYGMGPGMMPPGYGYGPPAGEPGGAYGMDPYGVGALKLTGKQQESIGDIEHATADKDWKLLGELRDEREKLYRMYARKGFDGEGFKAAYRTIFRIRRQMADNRVDAQQRISNVLTAEQRHEWQAMHRGMGYGWQGR